MSPILSAKSLLWRNSLWCIYLGFSSKQNHNICDIIIFENWRLTIDKGKSSYLLKVAWLLLSIPSPFCRSLHFQTSIELMQMPSSCKNFSLFFSHSFTGEQSIFLVFWFLLLAVLLVSLGFENSEKFHSVNCCL